ncbi:MAG: sensor histidine kinase [Anaerolineae bacterium]
MARRLAGLRVQILLWTIAPALVLVIAFLLTGVGEHRSAMRAMVSERDVALARALGAQVTAATAPYLATAKAVAAARASEPPSGASVSLLDGAAVVAGPALPAWVELWLADEAEDGALLLAPDGQSFAAIGRGSSGIAVVVSSLAQSGVPAALDTGALGGQAAILLLDRRTGGMAPFAADGASIRTAVAEAAAAGGVSFGAGGEYVTAAATVPGSGWLLGVREPLQPLIVPLLRLDRVMPFILFVAGAGSLLTLFFGLRFVVRPLQLLRQAAHRIGAGDFEAAAAPVGGVREIEDLRQALHSMAATVQHYQTTLQRYLAAVTRAQEDERARLARELHDETVQDLIALSQRVQMAQNLVERDPALARQRLGELRDMIGVTMGGLRRLSQALRPAYLEDLGLAPSLQILATEAGAQFGQTGSSLRLEPERELAFYRIAQEALSNARRHAAAATTTVSLEFLPGEARLRVDDDGQGFTVPERLSDIGRAGHFGLLGMQERALLAGGRLQVRSAPGAGTTVEATFPISTE